MNQENQDKKVYLAPKIFVENVEMEQGIAAGSGNIVAGFSTKEDENDASFD
ncbi:hypothetical protein [Sphingobacterium siyangense]|uniref:hypothetical protein n=1 Tax=Sphingobacterium siyangense TaxID=459529 RepID=UPI003DA55389